MKNRLNGFIAIVALTLIAPVAHAQWTLNTNTQKIYNVPQSSPVGIQTTNPKSPLHVRTTNTHSAFILEGSSNVFHSYYPNGYNGGSQAWLGFGQANSPHFTLRVKYHKGNIYLRPNEGDVILGAAADGTVTNLVVNHGFIQSNDLKIKSNAINMSNNHYLRLLNVEGEAVIVGSSSNPSDLAVNGKVLCREVLVKADYWPDYVFSDTYQLRSLREVETYVNQNKHLPGVPSEQEATENGVDVGEMQKILLEKVEELTLYTIEQQKAIEALMEQNQELTDRLNEAGQ